MSIIVCGVRPAYRGAGCGADYPQKCKGGVHRAGYKAMYFELFRASVQAVQLLQDAQTRAEQQLLAADLPPLRLDETEPDDP